MEILTSSSEVESTIRQHIKQLKASAKSSGRVLQRPGRGYRTDQPVCITVPIEASVRPEQARLIEISSDAVTVASNRYLERGLLILVQLHGSNAYVPARVAQSKRIGQQCQTQAKIISQYDPEVNAVKESFGSAEPSPVQLRSARKGWLARLLD